MGKGLSELQKGLLLMAWENFKAILENRENGSRMKAHLDHYGEDEDWAKRVGLELPHLTTLEALKGCTYAGARVSISRAFKRLEDRGLASRTDVERWFGNIWVSGINLTLKGKEMAKSLTVNVLPISEDINH